MNLIWHNLCVNVMMYLYNRCDCHVKKGRLFTRAYFHQEKLTKMKFHS